MSWSWSWTICSKSSESDESSFRVLCSCPRELGTETWSKVSRKVPPCPFGMRIKMKAKKMLSSWRIEPMSMGQEGTTRTRIRIQ